MEPKIMCKSIKLMLEVRILRFHDLSCMTLSKVTDLICTLAKWLEVREAMGPVMWRNCLGKANVTAVKIITLHCTKQWQRLPAAVSEQIAQCVQEKGIKAWYFLQRSPFKLNVRVDELLVWLSVIYHFCFLWPFTQPCRPCFPFHWFFLTLCKSLVAKYYFLNNNHGHFRMEHCCATGESRIALKFRVLRNFVLILIFISLMSIVTMSE